MARMSTEEFLNHKGPSSSGGGFFKIRDVGKSTGVIHPDGGIEIRRRHGMFIFSDDDNGKTKDLRASFNCTENGDGCPLCILKLWAEHELKDSPDMKDVILMSGGKGKSAIEFTLDDLAGNGYWDTKMTNVKEGLLVGWVPTEDIDSENPVYILDTNTALLMAIKALIKEAIDDDGEDGDLILNPYPIVIKYDGDTKDINKKYTAYRATGRKADIDDDVQEILDSPMLDEDGKGIDLSKISKPPKPEEVMDAIEKAWTGEIEFSEFETYYERRKDAGSKKGGGRKARGGHKAKNEDSGSDDGDGDVRQGGAASDAAHCSNCGTKMGKAVKFCPTCGTSRDEKKDDDEPPKKGGRKARKPKDDEPNKVKTHCPDCDEDVVPNKRGRCPECAKELDIAF